MKITLIAIENDADHVQAKAAARDCPYVLPLGSGGELRPVIDLDPSH